MAGSRSYRGVPLLAPGPRRPRQSHQQGGEVQVGAGQLSQVQGPHRRDGEGKGVGVDGGVPVEREGHGEAERHTQGGEQGAEQAVA